MESNRKLYKIEYDKKICGVCGGIGEYLKVDPTVIRMLQDLTGFNPKEPIAVKLP